MSEQTLPEPTPLRFDAQNGALEIADRTIRLTGVERKLVALLYARLGEPLTHSEIREGVWGAGWDGGDEALRVAINRLRKKLEANQRRPKVLISVRGVGYRLVGARTGN
mgnify:CR=1 FL=1